jgi:hypothetical protein
MEAPMRVHHVLAVAAVILVSVGAKLMLFPPIKAEADITSNPGMNVLQMEANHHNMPVLKIHDMTFVFANED